jgi:hypothetical protein
VWSLAGAWGVLVLTFSARMQAVPAGFLGGCCLPTTCSLLRADSQASPEHPWARVLPTQAGIVLGLLMALIILLDVHDRQRAIGASG